jgi:hypothetical protein
MSRYFLSAALALAGCVALAPAQEKGAIKERAAKERSIERTVLRLKHAPAGDAAKIISQIFRSDSATVAADLRTNSLFVSGESRAVEEITRLAQVIDEAPVSVAVTVVIAEVSGEKETKPLWQVTLTTANNQPSFVSVAGSRPNPAIGGGRARGSASGDLVVGFTPRVQHGGPVVMELDVQLVATRKLVDGVTGDEKGAGGNAPGKALIRGGDEPINVQTTITVPRGKTVEVVRLGQKGTPPEVVISVKAEVINGE